MATSKTLHLWAHLPKSMPASGQNQAWLKDGDNVENVERLHMGGHKRGTFAKVVSGARLPQSIQHNLDLLEQIAELSAPGAEIKIVQAVSTEATSSLVTAKKLTSMLKLAGLSEVQEPIVLQLGQEETSEIRAVLNINASVNFEVVEINCKTPSFETGSSRPLSFAQKVLDKQQQNKKSQQTAALPAKVWKLDLADDDVDLVNEDDLLDEEDKVRPDQASLRVCGTTGKRKACKDCSCGLAEELADGKEPTKKTVTSSCGSCYLGDAFRCASCPYLGMPAFKPGEKINLSERQLRPDQ